MILCNGNGAAPVDMGAARAVLDLVANGARQITDGLACTIQKLEEVRRLAERIAPPEEYAPCCAICSALDNLREALAKWQGNLLAADEERAIVLLAERCLAGFARNGHMAKLS